MTNSVGSNPTLSAPLFCPGVGGAARWPDKRQDRVRFPGAERDPAQAHVVERTGLISRRAWFDSRERDHGRCPAGRGAPPERAWSPTVASGFESPAFRSNAAFRGTWRSRRTVQPPDFQSGACGFESRLRCHSGVEQLGVLGGLINRRSSVRIRPPLLDPMSSNGQDAWLLTTSCRFESGHRSSGPPQGRAEQRSARLPVNQETAGSNPVTTASTHRPQARVAQSGRALPRHGKGRWFEPSREHPGAAYTSAHDARTPRTPRTPTGTAPRRGPIAVPRRQRAAGEKYPTTGSSAGERRHHTARAAGSNPARSTTPSTGAMVSVV